MKLEQQVTSLELSKKLKELGFEQNGYFSWLECDARSGGGWYVWQTDYDHMIELPDCSAYTVAELGKMLPRKICDQDQPLSGNKGKCYPLVIEGLSDDYSNENVINGWRLRYGDTKIKIDNDVKLNSAGIYYVGTEADARAKMLIYLKENNLI